MSFRVKVEGLREVGRKHRVVLAEVQEFRGQAAVSFSSKDAAGRATTRMVVLEPAQDNEVCEFSGFFVKGRFRIIERYDTPYRAKRMWKTFDPSQSPVPPMPPELVEAILDGSLFDWAGRAEGDWFSPTVPVDPAALRRAAMQFNSCADWREHRVRGGDDGVLLAAQDAVREIGRMWFNWSRALYQRSTSERQLDNACRCIWTGCVSPDSPRVLRQGAIALERLAEEYDNRVAETKEEEPA